MTDESSWLPADSERLWRRWLRLNALLPAALHRQLQADADLSLPDFDVLVQLTDSPEGRVRVTDLARALSWEKSRVSHHITRMERRGLVAREECRDDGRGAFVVLTPEGRAAIEKAAPGRVPDRALPRLRSAHRPGGRRAGVGAGQSAGASEPSGGGERPPIGDGAESAFAGCPSVSQGSHRRCL
jgi:DNA-binding MarR family transcriptional regulator